MGCLWAELGVGEEADRCWPGLGLSGCRYRAGHSPLWSLAQVNEAAARGPFQGLSRELARLEELKEILLRERP